MRLGQLGDALSKITRTRVSTRFSELTRETRVVGARRRMASDEDPRRRWKLHRGELAGEEEELRRRLGKLRGTHAMLLTPGIGLSFAAPETKKKRGLAAEKEELQKYTGSCIASDKLIEGKVMLC